LTSTWTLSRLPDARSRGGARGGRVDARLEHQAVEHRRRRVRRGQRVEPEVDHVAVVVRLDGPSDDVQDHRHAVDRRVDPRADLDVYQVEEPLSGDRLVDRAESLARKSEREVVRMNLY
jgi:hypothetical protein